MFKYLTVAILLSVSVVYSFEGEQIDIEIDDNVLSFNAPSDEYKIKVTPGFPIVVSVRHVEKDIIFAVTYQSYVSYGMDDINFEYLESMLMKNEKAFEKTRKNYERETFSTSKYAEQTAPVLVFRSTGYGGIWQTTVVTCFQDGVLVYFASMQCVDTMYDEVRPNFDKFLNSIRTSKKTS